MLVAAIVLQVLNLLLLGYIAWRMPKRSKVVSSFSVGAVGDMAVLSQVRAAAAVRKREGIAC